MQPDAVKKSSIEWPVDYTLDNRGEIAEARYSELSALYDAQTIRHIEQRGIQEGWSCLEVGVGADQSLHGYAPESVKPAGC